MPGILLIRFEVPTFIIYISIYIENVERNLKSYLLYSNFNGWF